MKKIIVFMLGFFLLLGCAQKGEKKGQYIAKINGATITEDDLKWAMEVFPAPMVAGEEGVTALVDALIKQELFYEEAKKKGLDKNEEYQNDLKKYQKKVEYSKKLILVKSLLEKEVANKEFKVSDEEIRAFYEKVKPNLKMAYGRNVKFEEIKNALANQLIVQKQNEFFESYFENLKKSHVIDINKDAIAAFSKNKNPNKEEAKEPAKETQKKEKPKK